jgi:hypothetical protein
LHNKRSLHTTHARIHPPLDQWWDQFHFAFALALELGAEAVLAEPVREIITLLDKIVRDDSAPETLRRQFRHLLQTLFNAMMPPSPSFSWTETSRVAIRKRFALLLAYERMYVKLRTIMGRRWQNSNARLLTLHEAFPDIPLEALRTWRLSKCAAIAQDLIAPQFDLKPQTIRKYLQLARKDLTRWGLTAQGIRKAVQAAPDGNRPSASEAAVTK